MNLGYDAYLARQHAKSCEREEREDAITARCEDRALWLGRDAGMLLEWLADHGTTLWDIKIKSAVTGKEVDAAPALLAHAPTWLRELVIAGGAIDGEALADTPVKFANGDVAPADVALIAHAPEWLRAELVDWLSKSSMVKADVKAELEEVAL